MLLLYLLQIGQLESLNTRKEVKTNAVAGTCFKQKPMRNIYFAKRKGEISKNNEYINKIKSLFYLNKPAR